MSQSITILLADDSEVDRLLVEEALRDHWRGSVAFHWVPNGIELLHYLRHQEAYQHPANEKDPAPRPDLILLDLNMPRKGGLEALQEIKGDPYLRSIPVIILTTSALPEDVQTSYDSGANSFIVKPLNYDDLEALVTSLQAYWDGIVSLPPKDWHS